MAVEASGGGGASAAEDFLGHAELEEKKEREMGGDFEHIACRDGDDYDSNGTEGSFVMVKSGTESDGRSDSSEKEIELDVSESVGDPPDLSGGQPSAANCNSSTFVDYERVVKGKIESKVGREEKGGEVAGKEERKVEDSSYSENKEEDGEMRRAGDQVHVSEVMHVTRGEAVVDSIRTDVYVFPEISTEAEEQDQKEGLALEDPNDVRGTAVEDLTEGGGVTAVDDSKYEEAFMVVEDSKAEEEDVSKDLNNKKEAVTCREELVSDATDACYVPNEVETLCEAQTIRLASSPITASDAIDAEHEVKYMVEKTKNVESPDTEEGSKKFEVVHEIEEGKTANAERSTGAEVSINMKKEGSTPEIKETRVINDELGKDIVSSVTEPAKEEILISDFEVERKINDKESDGFGISITEFTKDEGSKETESSESDHVVQIVLGSPNGAGNTANYSLTDYGYGENESKSAIQEEEKQQSKASQLDSDIIHNDGWSFTEEVQEQVADASLAKPAHDDKEDDSCIGLFARPVKENICSSVMVEHCQDSEFLSIGPSPVDINKAVNLYSRADDKLAEAFSHRNWQSSDSPTDSVVVDTDLGCYVEQIQKQDVGTLLSKSDTEGKKYGSSIESVAETIKEKIGSSPIIEEYQVVGASSTDQSLESVNYDVDLATRVENKHVEALSFENQQIKSSTDRNFVQYVDTSLSNSNSEESIGASSTDEQHKVAEASSAGQCPVSVNEGVSLPYFAEENPKAMFNANQNIKNSSIYSDGVDVDLVSYDKQVQQQDAKASLSKSDGEEKEPESSNESIESAKENFASSISEESQVAEVLSNDHCLDHVDEDANLASPAKEKNIEPLSIVNWPIKDSPTDFSNVDRNLKFPVECLQHVVSVSSKSDSVEKWHDSCAEVIAEPIKENIGSCSKVDEYLVAEGPSIAQSPESFDDDARLASQVEDKHVKDLSFENQERKSSLTGSDSVDKDFRSYALLEKEEVDACPSNSAIEENEPDSSIELVSEPTENNESSSILDEYQVVEASSFGQIPESVEDINLASLADHKHPENLSIEGNLVPFREELASPTETDENQHDEVSSIYLNLEPKEDGGLTSKPCIDMGTSERIELQPVTDISSLDAQPVGYLKRMKNQQSDLKSVKEHGSEDIVAESNKKRELKSATVIEESLKTHIDKDIGEIKEQQAEMKSEKQQNFIPIEQFQGASAPSPSNGDGEKSELHAKKYYIIKVPRFTPRVIDNERHQKIHETQMKVDENTRSRDSIKVELENMRKILSDCCHKKDSAIEEEKKARLLVNTKRQEMDSLQSVISRGKTASSFLDLTSQIHTLAHKMQHETISLKEEKKSIHELKQLEIEQEQHIFNKCSQSEIDEALKQKEAAESSLKALKKEFDLLRSAHLRADEFAKSASKNYINQFNKVKEHEKKWRAANELRQTAYKALHGLKSDKMDHFWRYMDDRQAARKYASSRDIDALERHCTEQIERILRLWKEEEDFRRRYIESNVSSTIRRFGTLDGRTVGLNEEPVALPNRVPPPLTTRSLAVPVQDEESGSTQEINRPALQPKKMVRSKPSSQPSSIESTPSIIVSVKEEIIELELERKTEEEEVQVKLEEEEKRREEKLRKEKEARELKEKIRMEQKIKAKEAEERKRRKSEKARARADFKAQKAAELREQKKEKKGKKKEDFPETTGSMEGENVSVTEMSSCETSLEPEKTSKRSARQSALALNKYSNRVQPVPLPLRNKGKRKTSMLVWTLCGAAAVGGLLLAGTYVSFSDISLPEFGF